MNPKQKRAVHRRDNYACLYCERKLTPRTATVDHVVPASRGGSSAAANLVTSCSRCNDRKGDQTPSEAGMPLPVERVDHRVTRQGPAEFGPQRGFEGE